LDPESHEWGYIGCKFFAKKMCAATAATPFLAAHLQSLQEFLPRQGADTLCAKCEQQLSCREPSTWVTHAPGLVKPSQQTLLNKTSLAQQNVTCEPALDQPSIWHD
jgi:hypothetical protein